MIEQMLDQLAELEAQETVFRLRKREAVAMVITPKIEARLLEIDVEFAPMFESISAQDEALREQIKQAVLKAAHSVKGKFIQAVWAKGREGGWDGDKLKGYAMAHPEIMAAKKPDGEPTVSFRKV